MYNQKQNKTNTGITVIPKIHIRKAFTGVQLQTIKKEILENKCTQKACTYADIHFNTFKGALKGNKIKSTQIQKLMEFCELIKKEKAA